MENDNNQVEVPKVVLDKEHLKKYAFINVFLDTAEKELEDYSSNGEIAAMHDLAVWLDDEIETKDQHAYKLAVEYNFDYNKAINEFTQEAYRMWKKEIGESDAYLKAVITAIAEKKEMVH